MSSLAHFTARRVIANAGNARLRLVQTRTNGFTHQTSQFRTWTSTKFTQKSRNGKAIAGGAALIVAGVAMYPSGRHSLYPGIPIPVTSLDRGGSKTDDSEVKVIVVEKLDVKEVDEKVEEPQIEIVEKVEEPQIEIIEKVEEPKEDIIEATEIVEEPKKEIEAAIEKIDEPEKSIEEVVEKVVEPVIEENIIQEPEITSPSKEPETAPQETEAPPVIAPETQTIPSDEIITEPEKIVVAEEPIKEEQEVPAAVATVDKTEEKTLDIGQKIVIEVKETPEKVPYLLIGAGTASFAAYRAIKAKDPTAKILIIGDENRLPYMRPPLSKELWYPPLEEVEEDGKKITRPASLVAIDDAELKFRQWNGRERSLYYEPEPFYTPLSKLENRENGGISVLKGRRVEKVDPKTQVAYLDDGTQIGYDKCLIATGE